MNIKEVIPGALDDELRRWKKINIWIDRMLLPVLLFLIAFTGSGMMGGMTLIEKGSNIGYPGFSKLFDINPDVIAWIAMDGTHIDYPVVRSKDNLDYLDKAFDGESYAGGTLFMDKENAGPEDPYCIIYGHNMAAGAMLGDLSRYLEPEFFEKYTDGSLLTPEYDYRIEVLAAGIFDAYDRNIYNTGRTVPLEYIKENTSLVRDLGTPDHVLALSTCLDDMSDDRIVVFCSLNGKRKHNKD